MTKYAWTDLGSLVSISAVPYSTALPSNCPSLPSGARSLVTPRTVNAGMPFYVNGTLTLKPNAVPIDNNWMQNVTRVFPQALAFRTAAGEVQFIIPNSSSGTTILPKIAAPTGGHVVDVAIGSTSASEPFYVALLDDGTVICGGDNTDGQCNVPTGLTGVQAVTTAGSRVYVIKSDGAITGWGATPLWPHYPLPGTYSALCAAGYDVVAKSTTDNKLYTSETGSYVDTMMLASDFNVGFFGPVIGGVVVQNTNGATASPATNGEIFIFNSSGYTVYDLHNILGVFPYGSENYVLHSDGTVTTLSGDPVPSILSSGGVAELGPGMGRTSAGVGLYFGTGYLVNYQAKIEEIFDTASIGILSDVKLPRNTETSCADSTWPTVPFSGSNDGPVGGSNRYALTGVRYNGADLGATRAIQVTVSYYNPFEIMSGVEFFNLAAPSTPIVPTHWSQTTNDSGNYGAPVTGTFEFGEDVDVEGLCIIVGNMTNEDYLTNVAAQYVVPSFWQDMVGCAEI